MPNNEIEHRLDALERAVAEIRQHLALRSPTGNWAEQRFGSVPDEKGMAEAFEYGQAYRRGQTLPDDDGSSP